MISYFVSWRYKEYSIESLDSDIIKIPDYNNPQDILDELERKIATEYYGYDEDAAGNITIISIYKFDKESE